MGVKRLTGLDALRGIAAIIVAYVHARHLAELPQQFPGYLAVDFFFLLSGFVLSHAYECRMEPSSFFVARFKRLWPMITLGVLMGAAFDLWIGWPLWAVALKLMFALALLPFLDGLFNYNAPAWSIFFELVANALHAVVLRHLSVRWLAAIVFASFATMAARADVMDVGQAETFAWGFPRVLMSYTLGVIIYRVNGPTAWGNWPIAVISLPAMMAIGAILPDHFQILALALAPIALMSGMSFQSPKVGRWLGELSFPLYAIHWPVQLIALNAGVHWLSAFAASLMVGGLLAYASVKLRNHRMIGPTTSIQVSKEPVVTATADAAYTRMVK